jgi:hypothetical protein
MKIKLPILLLIALFSSAKASAQDTILRKLKHDDAIPHFWLLGIDDNSFPRLKNTATSADSAAYGKDIVLWIGQNEVKMKALEANPQQYLFVNFEDFKKFNPEQKAAFKAISKESEPILKYQKVRIKQKEKELLGKKLKANEINNTQIYLLSSSELLIWKKRLGI